MLEVRDIRVAFGSSRQQQASLATGSVLSGKGMSPGGELSGERGLDIPAFRIEPGERIAVIGANGSGKSTFLRLLSGLSLPMRGEVIIDGLDARQALPDPRLVGMVFQDPMNQMVSSTVAEEVAFGPCNLGLPRQEILSSVADALSACGLGGFGDRDVQTLSGGQLQRLCLASSLACDPAYLLLDEPCAMLDPAARREFLEVIRDLAGRGCGIVHVTHHLCEVLDYDEVIAMGDGRIFWRGSPSELVGSPDILKRSAVLTAGVEGVTTHQGGVGSDADLVAVLAGSPDLPTAAGFGAGDAGEAHDPRLRASAVTFSYEGGSFSLNRGEPLDLVIEPAQITLVVGASGSGKSTLMQLLGGLQAPGSGSITIDDVPVSPGDVGMAFQRPEDQLFSATVIEDAMFGPLNQGLDRQAAREVAEAALRMVGLDDEALWTRSPFQLSGGQMRRVAFAGVLAMGTRYILLDEPLAGLDARGCDAVRSLLAGLRARGRSICVVTHDAVELMSLADRVIRLEEGLVTESPAAIPGVDLFAVSGGGGSR